MFSEGTKEPNMSKVPIMDLAFPWLFCLSCCCCCFLIITPTRQCLPIETITKWVENSVRFISAVGSTHITDSLKKESQKKQIQFLSFTLRYHYLTRTVHGSKGKRCKQWLPNRLSYFCISNINKCLSKCCLIISFLFPYSYVYYMPKRVWLPISTSFDK